VVTVDNGVVTAVAEGTATITVTTADGGFSDTCAVTVHPSVIVTFNSNGGSSVSSQTLITGTPVSRPGNPTQSSYVFDYWYSDEGLTARYSFSTPVTVNITLYARWVSEAVIQEIANNMLPVTGGTFTMGSPAGEAGRDSDETEHSVTLTKNFKMSKYQVTQKQYQAVMGALPTSLPGSSYGVGDNYPVYYVSWYDAIVFCNKLSMLEGLDPMYSISNSTNPDDWGAVPASSDATWNAVTMVPNANGYRLPTEAEWEYVCRAGTTTAFNNGNDDYTDATEVGKVAWYNNNAGSKTQEVGLKTANAYGLYDMHGNVYEWCWDWYGTYASGAQTDPDGAVTGTDRVRRGGYRGSNAQFLRSACRNNSIPYSRNADFGFRLVRGE
jgi:uncharacterized repeat protein (TIGR02543 family)